MLILYAFAVIGFMGFGWGAAWTERNHLRARCEEKARLKDYTDDGGIKFFEKEASDSKERLR